MTYGVMATGGNPAEGRREADFYSTPEDASEAALMGIDGLAGLTGMWEPACGDGRLCRVAERIYPDWEVIATDLFNRDFGEGDVDFLTAPWPSQLDKNSSAILTNPPFSLSEQFIRRSLEHDPAMIVMFSKSTYYHAENRRAFFNEMRPQIKYDLTFRVDFSGQGRPTMECSWLVWHRGPKQLCEIKLLPRATPRPRKTKPVIEDEWDIL